MSILFYCKFSFQILGFSVQGVFMQNWDIRDETGVCSVENDYQDAAYVCEKLNIKLHLVNFVKEYWNEVFWYVKIQFICIQGIE